MEQNSFLFQQTSLLGWTHRQTIEYVMDKKLASYDTSVSKKEAIPVVFG